MGKKVVRVSKDGEEKTFETAAQAAKETGVPHTSLHRHLKRGKGGLLGEWTWRYEEEIPPVAPAAPSAEAGPSEPAPGAVEYAVPVPTPHEFAHEFFEALKTEDGRLITELRLKDGYINATKMCQSAGKGWKHYWENSTTASFIGSLSSKVGIPTTELVNSTHGNSVENRGTWVHPRVAIHLAQWCSADFAVAVTDLVLRYTKGEVTTEESKAAANIVKENLDAELESRKRKLEMEEAEWALQKKKKAEEQDQKERDLQLSIRQREENILALRTDPNAIAHFYETAFSRMGLALDGKDKIVIKDAILNACRPATDAPSSRLLMPISDIYRSVTGRAGTRIDWMKIGRIAAATYRVKNGGKEPPQAERIIDGTSRMINCYTAEDCDLWLKQIIVDYVA